MGKPTTAEWIQERYDNTGRIAAMKTGDDRAAWLEDRCYWKAIIDERKALLEACELALTEARERDEDLGANCWPQLRAAIQLARGEA